MNIGGLRLGRLSDGELFEPLRRARQGAPTYDHVGSTLAARAAGPLARWLQHAALRRYLHAIAEYVTRGNRGGTN